MKIIIATENKEKLKGVQLVFPDAEIVSLKAKSYIGNFAFNGGLFNGVYNRVVKGVLEDYGFGDDDWDLIIAIQTGFCEKDFKYYITDVCAVCDKNGYRIGNGPMFEVSKNVYDCVGQGGIIESIIGDIVKRDQVNGVLQYISEGVLNRQLASMLAVNAALNSGYKRIAEVELDYSRIITFDNPNTCRLNDVCYKINRENLNDSQGTEKENL